MSELIYIFRNTKTFFSIENIFRQVAEENAIRHTHRSESITLPYGGFNPQSLLKNGFFARRLSADLYHVTGDTHYITLFLPGRKSILTIHDCGFLHQNRGIKRWLLKKINLDWPVAHCRLITTVSQQTKDDILRLTGCPEDKVVVIPNPVNRRIREQPAIFNRENPVVLFIGTTPNKNLSLAIDAIRGLSCTLDIVGRLPSNLEEKLNANNIVYRNSFNLSDEEIADKYASCDIVLFPSIFEGFGMPIIEGQKTGRPVITSNLSPMKEVAGGAACLVDPLSRDSIREGIEKLINEDRYREELIRKGLENSSRFGINEISRQYNSLYDRIIERAV